MNPDLERLVRQRARGLCEYCRLPAKLRQAPFQIDHIIAVQHGGQTVPENLALACVACNLFKGPNIAGVDPDTGQIRRLFHPRKDQWHQHFAWNGFTLIGRTGIGRATIQTLRMNRTGAVEFRQSLSLE